MTTINMATTPTDVAYVAYYISVDSLFTSRPYRPFPSAVISFARPCVCLHTVSFIAELILIANCVAGSKKSLASTVNRTKPTT